MQQAVILRSAAGRACNPAMASSRTTDNSRAVPDAARSRRSILLGMGAGLAGLASSTSNALAATPRLSDLVLPVTRAMDANGDGLLDVDEIRGAMQRSGAPSVPRETIVRDVMSVVDFDDDANVSVDEFARGMSLDLQVDERWMRLMERDGVAGISQAELAAGLGDLGQRGREVLPVAFKMADSDRDGLLSQSEARNVMRFIAAGVLGE